MGESSVFFCLCVLFVFFLLDGFDSGVHLWSTKCFLEGNGALLLEAFEEHRVFTRVPGVSAHSQITKTNKNNQHTGFPEDSWMY